MPHVLIQDGQQNGSIRPMIIHGSMTIAHSTVFYVLMRWVFRVYEFDRGIYLPSILILYFLQLQYGLQYVCHIYVQYIWQKWINDIYGKNELMIYIVIYLLLIAFKSVRLGIQFWCEDPCLFYSSKATDSTQISLWLSFFSSWAICLWE